MKPEFEGLIRSHPQGMLAEYKDKLYRVQTVTPGLLSQDPETGEWVPSIIYEVANETRDTQVVGSLTLKFTRPVTEFARKFKKVSQKKNK